MKTTENEGKRVPHSGGVSLGDVALILLVMVLLSFIIHVLTVVNTCINAAEVVEASSLIVISPTMEELENECYHRSFLFDQSETLKRIISTAFHPTEANQI